MHQSLEVGKEMYPNNVNVKILSIPIFGGAANKARPCTIKGYFEV